MKDIKFVDANIGRKGAILESDLNRQLTADDAPVFSLIEFNLSGLCTRKCVFCPRVDPAVYPNLNKHFPVDLFGKVMRELRDAGYRGTILFSAFSEPLQYKELRSALRLARASCPDSRIEIVSNGDLLDEDVLKDLFSDGLTVICVSMYDGPHQAAKFEGIRDKAGLKKEQMFLRPRWLSAEEHYGITLSNRAGAVKLEAAGVGELKEPLKQPCYYPFYQLLIDYDGSVLLCAHDWRKGLVAGSVADKTVWEIWNGPVFRRVRQSLARSDRNFSPCRGCDVHGLLMGEGHFRKWMEYYESQKQSGR